MAVESFNDTALGNGAVPKAGSRAGAQPSATAKSTGRPAAVSEADGTENMRADSKTRSASLPSTPSGGGTKWPATVDSFNGEKV